MEPGILLALGSGVAFACYMIATRQAAQESDPVQTLLFQCVVGTALSTPQAAMTWSVPAGNDVVFFVALGVLSAASHILSIVAFRWADASTLAPLVYLELIGAGLTRVSRLRRGAEHVQCSRWKLDHHGGSDFWCGGVVWPIFPGRCRTILTVAGFR